MITRLFFALLILATLSGCNNDGNTYALISTDMGDMKVKLYNSTPQHRDNFIKLAEEGFYDGTLFHRIIAGFMIQGGDPDSKDAPAGQSLGMGGPGYTIPAEIGALHLTGALAAARTSNPAKASSGSQFYIVHGKPVTDMELDQIGQRTGRPYSDVQRELYKELGGTPQLDFEYTVFGEVVEGFEVIDAIAKVSTNPSAGNRPLEDVKMTIKILN
ncbi:peptidylprolyl isomerase [Lewinella cohaerens]|uniref:peptidylprolyl isomerase n=1 Tax=Lewinella cohaerens TaxID=70995 RepID=UPI000378A255|nr:peptidylprolyl isomerase [Lewinella cohaerens]